METIKIESYKTTEAVRIASKNWKLKKGEAYLAYDRDYHKNRYDNDAEHRANKQEAMRQNYYRKMALKREWDRLVQMAENISE